METTALFLIYPVLCIFGAVLTQFTGNEHRPFHEGLLAWLFLPIGIIACLSALSSEGVAGMKNYLHDFFETMFNHSIKTKEKNTNTHNVTKDLA